MSPDTSRPLAGSKADDQPLPGRPVCAEDVIKHCDPLAGARLRGIELKREIFDSVESLTADEVARRLGVDHSNVRDLVAAGKLLELRHPTDRERVRYPDWQLEEPVLKALPPILESMRSLDGWEIWLFLTSADPVLRQLAPLEVMRGRTESAEDMERLQELVTGNEEGVLLETAARRFVADD